MIVLLRNGGCNMADGTFVSWLVVDGDKIVGTSGMLFW